MWIWNCASVAAHAMLKRIYPKNDEVTMVLQMYFSASRCDIRNLSASFAWPKAFLGRPPNFNWFNEPYVVLLYRFV